MDMDEKINIFLDLAKEFVERGYRLYLVGGTVRDYLLNIPLTDMDAVSDALPEQMKEFIDGDYTFSYMGSVKYKYKGVKFDITTLREEEGYLDHRHPLKVKFVKDIRIDHYRRDFTVNAMYLDDKLNLYDYENGLTDLNNRILKMVGNPYVRLKEDPLRIIRLLRFSLAYNFTIDEELIKAVEQSISFLNDTSKSKIDMEIKKMKGIDIERAKKLFDKFYIKHLLDVIE